MRGTVTRMFPGNNSARGFFSYYDSNLKGAEKVFILKGGPGTGKSSLMKSLAATFLEQGCDAELWRCSSDCDSLDGLWLPAYQTAVVDGTSPHVVEPRYPGVKEEIVNLGDCWDEAKLALEKEKIVRLTDRISEAFGRAYGYLADVGEADRAVLACRREDGDAVALAKERIREISGDSPEPARHFFAAAVTPKGMVDLTLERCRRYGRRWFFVGKRGLGQQRCFAALAAQGAKAEIGHGCIDPEEVVMMCFPDLDLAVAAVAELPPSERREDDVVIDFVFAGEDDRSALAKREMYLAAAVAEIALAHSLHDELEACYIPAMDFKKVEKLTKNIARKITKKV